MTVILVFAVGHTLHTLHGAISLLSFRAIYDSTGSILWAIDNKFLCDYFILLPCISCIPLTIQ